MVQRQASFSDVVVLTVTPGAELAIKAVADGHRGADTVAIVLNLYGSGKRIVLAAVLVT